MHRSMLAALAAMLAGCSMAPPHVRPELPTPVEYPTAYADDPFASGTAAQIGWREFFRDGRLEALIETALEHNRDLAIAITQIDEARGILHIERADRLPTVGVAADAGRFGVSQSEGGGDAFDRYSIGVGVSAFEIDLWGRVRSLSEAARSQFLATVAASRAVRLSLIREVAATYLASVEVAEQIRLAEATVEARREGVRIARVRFDAGLTSGLDYRQAESLLTQAETELAGLRLARARTENALAVLVGGPVGSVPPPALPLGEQANAVVLAVGVPSELLVARPDIIAAEERLRAARANIGAARAAFFPRISLTGLFGFASDALDRLVGDDSQTWNYGASITAPIFDFGRNGGNLTVAEAREDIAIASYERTIQTAFREVADALAGRRYLAEQVAAQERGAQAQREIAELARIRYNEGVVSFIEVLDAERNLFAAEQALLQLRRAEADNLVALYVALGGGLME